MESGIPGRRTREELHTESHQQRSSSAAHSATSTLIVHLGSHRADSARLFDPRYPVADPNASHWRGPEIRALAPFAKYLDQLQLLSPGLEKSGIPKEFNKRVAEILGRGHDAFTPPFCNRHPVRGR